MKFRIRAFWMNLKRDVRLFAYDEMVDWSLTLLGQVDEIFGTNYQVRFLDMLLFRQAENFHKEIIKIRIMNEKEIAE